MPELARDSGQVLLGFPHIGSEMQVFSGYVYMGWNKPFMNVWESVIVSVYLM